MAEVPPLTCTDQANEWALTINEDVAFFAYLDRTSEMQVMQRSVAENQDWPVAMTVVGPRDSGIVILEGPQDGAYAVRVLTQRGETPILLAGQCRATP